MPKRDLVQEAAANSKNIQVEEIQRIKAGWDKFDINGDGTVSVTEVDQFLEGLSINVPDSKKEYIISQLDRNNNGTIEFVEFVKNYANGLFNDLN